MSHRDAGDNRSAAGSETADPAARSAADATEGGAGSGTAASSQTPPAGEARANHAGSGRSATIADVLHELVRPVARCGHALIERPGLRLAVIGAGLVAAAFELGSGSALSVPLLVVGLVMLVVGVLGSRLRGRFVLDFGPGGMVIEARAEVAPPPQATLALPPKPRITLVTPTPDEPSVYDEDDVIEGHGETIEMDVAQLRRLLAAERADVAGG